MEQDHKNYNVQLKHKITINMLKKEWLKTKIGVYNTIKAAESADYPEIFAPFDKNSIEEEITAAILNKPVTIY